MTLSTLIRNWLRYAAGPNNPMQSGADYMRLEERIVYSAAPVGDLSDVDLDLDQNETEFTDFEGHSTGDSASIWNSANFTEVGNTDFADLASIPSLIEDQNAAFATELLHELVFVDTQTENYEQLVDDLQSERPDAVFDVVLIDADADGIESITNALKDFSDLDAIHIVSHGTNGVVELGATELSIDSVGGHAGSIAAWGDALQTEGDILFYGCDLASNDSGMELLESIGELTQADVAASEDLTGHESLGGNWILEFEYGDVETDIAFSYSVQASWVGALEVSDSNEILVNSDPVIDTTEEQVTSRDDDDRSANSAVAISSVTGNHVVVWTNDSSTTGEDVYFQLFDWAGREIGGAVRVNETLAGNQDEAAVAMDADGNFVVAWESNEPGFGNDVFARRFDANGTPLIGTAGDQFRVTTTAVGSQENPDIDMNDAGQFVIGWEGVGLGSTNGAFIQVFDSNGVKTTPNEILVNQGMVTEGAAIDGVSVGIDGAGNVIAAWDETVTTNVEIRRFDNTGTALGNEILPDTIEIMTGLGLVQTNLNLEHADVDVREDGNVAVSATAWLDGQSKNVIAFTYLPDLSNSIDISLFESPVSDSTTGDQLDSSVVFYDDDTLLVTWEGPSDASDVNDAQGVYGKVLQASYDVASNETTVVEIVGQTEFTINQTIGNDQEFASVASREADNFVVVWSGNGPGDADGVFMRQFGTRNGPVAVEDTLMLLEDGSGTFDPALNDWDPNDDTIVVVSADFAGLTGSAVLNGDGTISYDTNGQFDNLAAGDSASEQFTYTISDGNESATATVTIDINGFNSVPVANVIDSITVAPGSIEVISSSQLSYTDADNIDPSEITYTIATPPSVANGILWINGTAASAGSTFTQQGINDGLVMYEKAVGNAASDQFTFSVADPSGATAATATFSVNSSPNLVISGHVFEDVNGDSDLGDAVGMTSGTGIELVHLYRDNGDGQIDANDVWLDSTATDANGYYEFFAGTGEFFVTVSSEFLQPTLVTKYNSGFGLGDIWAEQTYGSEGALVADGAGGTRQLGPGGGAGYGGRVAGQSDVSGIDITDKQHVTVVSVVGSDVVNVDYGFSFNVVTNTLAGDTTDHSGANRTVQGSLRQFIQNANAINSANVMRFVPAEAANAGDWWRIDVTEILDPITDNDTVIDGRAYDFLDGTQVRDVNTVQVGYTGKVGTGADGVVDSGDEVFLNGVAGPELEIVADLGDDIESGLSVQASNTIIQHVAIHGFGDASASNDGNIVVGSSSFEAVNTQIRDAIIGAAPNASDTILAMAEGSNNHGIYFNQATSGVVQNTVVVGAGRAGIKFSDANSITIENNEIRGNGSANNSLDGIDMSANVRDLEILNNLFVDNFGGGIDAFRSSGDHEIVGNSIVGNGKGTSDEGFGLRLFGSDSLVTQNVFQGNRDNGLQVVGSQPGSGSPALRNQLTQNSFDANGGIAIDLIQGTNDANNGDGIDVAQDGYNLLSGNQSIDRPELTGFVANQSGYSFTFSDVWGGLTPDIELYLASDSDSSDTLGGQQFGEGKTYIGTATFDGTNYTVSNPNGYSLQATDRITGIAIDSLQNTSEFSNVVNVDFIRDDSFATDEDVQLVGDVSANDQNLDGAPLIYGLVNPLAGLTLSTDGAFIYVPPIADASGQVAFQYSATDESGNFVVATVTIDVVPVNDEEVLVENNPLQIAEGASGGITSALLLTTDVDNLADQLIYLVDVAPQHGQLELNSDPGIAATFFTQDDVDFGRLSYVHNSAEFDSDVFTFLVDDGIGNFTSADFSIEVTNAEEQLINAVDIAVGFGSTTTLTQAELLAEDVDDSNSQLIYTLANPLQHGQIELASSVGTSISSFSQQDINDGIVRYVHGGGISSVETLNFDVDDGQGTNLAGSLNITILNESPQGILNEGLTLGEGTVALIDASMLLATDVDNTADQLSYSVTTPLQHGQLELSTSPGVEVTTFTQEDIDNDLLQYRHDSSDSVSDAFAFSVDDGSGGSLTGTFDIDVVNDEEQLINQARVFVGKGDTEVITQSNLLTTDTDDLQSELVYTVNSPTGHGYLYNTSDPSLSISTFTQEQIDNGEIWYQHDGTASNLDAFGFTVNDGTQGEGSEGQLEFIVVNSEQLIVTNNPLSLNEGASANIGILHLRTVDVDDPPSARIYTVIGAPGHGHLELSTSPGVPITSFSQADINQGRLSYHHDSSDASTDSFFFSVNDGIGVASLARFEILVSNQEEALVNSQPLTIGEGGAQLITNGLLRSTDVDDLSDEIVYTVTSAPSNGVLRQLPSGAVVTTFTQAQIDNGLIGYEHDGSETGADSFDFQVDDGQGSVSIGTFAIAVDPVNDAPDVHGPGLQRVAENSPIFFSTAAGNAILIDDVDSGSSIVELSLSATSGRMNLATTNGLTFVVGDGNQDTSIVVQGTIDDLRTALDGLRFRPLQNFHGDANIEVTLNDLGNSGAGGPLQASDTVLVRVFDQPNAVNDPKGGDNFLRLPGHEGPLGNLSDNDFLPVGTSAPTLVNEPGLTAEHGTVTILPTGDFFYEPSQKFLDAGGGVDQFTYQIANGVATDRAVVTVVVGAPSNSTQDSTPDTDANSDPTTDVDANSDPTTDVDDIQTQAPGPDINGDEGEPNRVSNSGSPSDSQEVVSSTVDVTLPGSSNREVGNRNQLVTSSSRQIASDYGTGRSASKAEFETGTFELSTSLGQFDIFVGMDSGQRPIAELDLFSVDAGAWQVPTGLALTGGLSVGWVAWSLNSGYVLGSLLSTISPWTLVDPLPVLDTFGSRTRDKKEKDETKDKLDEMID